jgi:hypothetical protein
MWIIKSQLTGYILGYSQLFNCHSWTETFRDPNAGDADRAKDLLSCLFPTEKEASVYLSKCSSMEVGGWQGKPVKI